MNVQTIHLALAVFLLPLVGFVVLALFNRYVPRRGDWLVVGAMGIAVVLALIIFYRAMAGASAGKPLCDKQSWEWLLLDRPRVPADLSVTQDSSEREPSPQTVPLASDISPEGRVRVGILLDGLTAVMLVVVTVVSFLVYFYSAAYMKGDVRYGRYFASLSLFSTCMLGLVLSDNLLTLYIFWELVGFCSYVLIGHWFERKSAADAALKAFVTTRIGDVGMLIGILLIYWNVGSFRFEDIFRHVNAGGMSQEMTFLGISKSLRFWAAIGLFLGAMGKSAQFPLHVWLPDAMEGPTPVSALIHAATMVAAGVYLVGRMHPFFPPEALLVVAYIGVLTAAMSATIALVMYDVKKVLAYSTISQLGYMMLGLGVGGVVGGVASGFVFGLFHLTTHAFFKAGLFLGSGSVIHAMHHEQSMFQYGGLARKMPVTFVTFLLFTLALCGFPYLSSGFFTKDGIIAAALEFGMIHGHHRFLGWMALGAAGLTSFYMFRLIFLTFAGQPRNRHLYDHARESSATILLPLIMLALLSLGFVGSNRTFGLVARESWFSQIVQRPEVPDYATEKPGLQVTHDSRVSSDSHDIQGTHATDEQAHFAHRIATVGSTVAFSIGLFVAFVIYYLRWIEAEKIATACRPIYTFLLNKWYMDHIYRAVIVLPYLAICYMIRLFDTYLIDAIVNLWGWLGRIGSQLIGNVDLAVVDGAVNGTAHTTGFAGRMLRLTQTGQVRNYILFLITGAVALVVLFSQF